jgi:hypothetical protein
MTANVSFMMKISCPLMFYVRIGGFAMREIIRISNQGEQAIWNLDSRKSITINGLNVQ